MLLPFALELYLPLTLSYVALKLYEDVAMDGALMFGVYQNIFFKILPMIAALVFVLQTDLMYEEFKMAAGLAVVFSMGGDVLLELKHFKHHFVLGLGSFLIAHLFYAFSFSSKKPVFSVATVMGTLVMGGAITFLGGVFGEAAPPEMALPVMTYCGVIGLMVVLSIVCSTVPRPKLAIAGRFVSESCCR